MDSPVILDLITNVKECLLENEMDGVNSLLNCIKDFVDRAKDLEFKEMVIHIWPEKREGHLPKTKRVTEKETEIELMLTVKKKEKEYVLVGYR